MVNLPDGDAVVLAEEANKREIPVVLLAADDDPLAGSTGPRAVLPLEVDPNTLRQAIVAVAHGERWVARPRQGRTSPTRPDAAGDAAPAGAFDSDLGVIAVTGGTGSPGRTTLAINLAVTLVVSVALDLMGVARGTDATAPDDYRVGEEGLAPAPRS